MISVLLIGTLFACLKVKVSCTDQVQRSINWHKACLSISGSWLYRSSAKIYKLARSLLEYKWKLVVQIKRKDL